MASADQPVEWDLLLGALPVEPNVGGLSAEIRAAVRDAHRRIVVLDDDPTGVQTVHDVDVLTTWDVDALVEALRAPEPLFYILTNSRALSRTDAVRLAGEVVDQLVQASDRTGITVDLISRSDSTLRGHYPWELEPLARLAAPNGFDGVLIVPAFPEGGRVTVGGIHYVRDGSRLIPASHTDFARDPTFGYSQSFLPAWVEEKSNGRWPASQVLQVPIETLRAGDVDGVCAILLAAQGGRPIVADAATYGDLTVLVAGLVRAGARGHRFLCRTAASFVKVRASLDDRPPLTRDELVPGSGPAPGLVLVGSYVERTAQQLTQALALPGLEAHEVSVPRLLADHRAEDHLRAVSRWASQTVAAGRTALVYTSRELITHAANRDHTAIAGVVSAAVARIAASIDARPAWIIAKGGITASEVGTQGLGVRRARVLGQISTGVPVWRLGAETRFPGLPYVVFPGNVGTFETLAELIAMLDPRVRAES